MILNKYKIKMIVEDPDKDEFETEGVQISKDKFNAVREETELNIKIGYKIKDILSVRKVAEINIPD